MLMAHIANIIGLWEKLESADIEIREERCVVVRDRNARCRLCAQACTTGCISLEDRQLRVDAQKCVGCGTCTTVCPSAALIARMPDDRQLRGACDKALRAAGDGVAFVCEQAMRTFSHAIDPEKVVGVTCLGRVDESVILHAVDAGAQAVALVHASCAECALEHGEATAREVVQTAGALLEAWERPERISLVDEPPQYARCAERAGYDRQRRRFFSTLKEELKSAAGVLVENQVSETLDALKSPCGESEDGPLVPMVTADGTLPHFIPERRSEMLSVLRSWDAPEEGLVSTRLWGNVVIDEEKCASCRMCAVFCPTGSLRRTTDDDGYFGLAHTPAICVRCRTCQSVCPAGALHISSEVFTSDVVEGSVERIMLKPPACEKTGPHSAVNAMRFIIGSDRIYER